QGRLRRPEDSDFCVRSAAQRRRPEQIIATLQFLRPEIPAGISAKTAFLLPTLYHLAFRPKNNLWTAKPSD
ncbi:MAG: hypothetical protein II697_01350, partial [Clostridia bacterium]|nr:hypothetical protein [Clostridia bacterium]